MYPAEECIKNKLSDDKRKKVKLETQRPPMLSADQLEKQFNEKLEKANITYINHKAIEFSREVEYRYVIERLEPKKDNIGGALVIGSGHIVPVITVGSSIYIVEGLEGGSKLTNNLKTSLEKQINKEIIVINTNFQTEHNLTNQCGPIAITSFISALTYIEYVQNKIITIDKEKLKNDLMNEIITHLKVDLDNGYLKSYENNRYENELFAINNDLLLGLDDDLLGENNGSQTSDYTKFFLL